MHSNHTGIGHVVLESRDDMVGMQRTAYGINFRYQCQQILGRLEQKIKNSVGCSTSEVTALLNDLHGSLPLKDTKVSAAIICSIHAGLEKCPPNLQHSLKMLTFDAVIHRFHGDCITEASHLFLTEKDFKINEKIILNYRLLDIFLGTSFLVGLISFSKCVKFRKIAVKCQILPIRTAAHALSYAWSVTVILILITIGTIRCKTMTFYNFLDLTRPISFKNPENSVLLKELSKIPSLLLTSPPTPLELTTVDLQKTTNSNNINSNSEELFENISTEQRSMNMENYKQKIQNHIKNYKRTDMLLKVILSVTYIVATWTYIHLIFTNINFNF